MPLPPERAPVPDQAEPLVPAQEYLPESGRLGWAITRLARLFAVGIIIAMAVLVVEIFLRYVFNSPTIWAHETTTFLSRRHLHLRWSFLCRSQFAHPGRADLRRGQQRARRVLDVLISMASLLACLFFAWASWLMVKKAMFRPDGSFFLETSGSAWNSPAPALLKIILLVVMVTMSIQFLILTVNYLRRPLRTGGDSDA